MKSIREMQQFEPVGVNYSKIQKLSGRPVEFALEGELGFRLHRSINRIESVLPYSQEYLLSQISAAAGEWSHFPRAHGDVAGRWLLAQTYAKSACDTPPAHVRSFAEALIALQNEDGSFGKVQFDEEPLNMHKAYGNAWILKALSQYAITFQNDDARNAAIRLGEFYINTFDIWRNVNMDERDTRFYAISISCYYHALVGLVMLYRLTHDKRFLDLAGEMIPLLPPLQRADHAHMCLTIRRGWLEYAIEQNSKEMISEIASQVRQIKDQCVLEIGGMPERFWLPKEGFAEDEGCALFDWSILNLRLYEITSEPEFLTNAILNLENHIFYNQIYNGGFGSYELGDQYKQQGKEAPWCCSLFGPYGLLETSSLLLRKRNDTLEINHLLSGTFIFDGDQVVHVARDDEHGVYRIDTSGAPAVRAIAVFNPDWLDLSGNPGALRDGRFVIPVDTPGNFELRYRYRIWVSAKGAAPKRLTEIRDGASVVLFYGPWLLCHRFNDRPTHVHLELDGDGFVTNAQTEFLLGMGFWGESTRIVVPSDRTVEPTDVFLGVYEADGDLFLYPLKDKESPNQGHSEVFYKRA